MEKNIAKTYEHARFDGVINDLESQTINSRNMIISIYWDLPPDPEVSTILLLLSLQ